MNSLMFEVNDPYQLRFWESTMDVKEEPQGKPPSLVPDPPLDDLSPGCLCNPHLLPLHLTPRAMSYIPRSKIILTPRVLQANKMAGNKNNAKLSKAKDKGKAEDKNADASTSKLKAATSINARHILVNPFPPHSIPDHILSCAVN